MSENRMIFCAILVCATLLLQGFLYLRWRDDQQLVSSQNEIINQQKEIQQLLRSKTNCDSTVTDNNRINDQTNTDFKHHETNAPRIYKSHIKGNPRDPEDETIEPRKIFIDLGANCGDTLKEFRLAFPELTEYETWLFEPEADFKETLLAIEEREENVHFMPYAVWTENTTLEFYSENRPKDENKYKECGEKDAQHLHGGSSLFGSKKSNYTIVTQVKTVDFSQWLMGMFSPFDEIVLKIDVEGVEYPLLRKMMLEGSICYVDRIYVELHKSVTEYLKFLQYTLEGCVKEPTAER